MSDSNNEPQWKEESTEGNGRSWQQNDLPKGARTASPQGNAPKGERSDELEGNGFGEYDPRNPKLMGEVKDGKWNVSGYDDVADVRNPIVDDPKITRSNALENDALSADRANPHREATKAEWFGKKGQGVAGYGGDEGGFGFENPHLRGMKKEWGG